MIENMNDKSNPLLTKSFEFAVQIIRVNQKIQTEYKEYILTKQLIRSGTSIGALVREAQNAETKKDFIHKLSIAQKECDETIYWIELMHETDYFDVDIYQSLKLKGEELLRIIRSSILTAKRNLNA
jgi:four helix bundle protein